MAIHVAILYRPYIEMILGGRKTIESRLTINACPPYGQIKLGERIFFKASGGHFMATAIAQKIEFFNKLYPQAVKQLYRQFNDRVCGEPEYWDRKRTARHATFITLEQVRPSAVGPKMKPSQGAAWFVMPNQKGLPLPLTYKLTAGAMRNHYVRLLSHRKKPMTLLLPDQTTVQTEITPLGLMRWRGWRGYFQSQDLSLGDEVRFEPLGSERYRVHFHKQVATIL